MAASLFRQWKAFQKAFLLARKIFIVSRGFPKEEKYSLTDQVRRSSRSVCANLAEASAKRRYSKNWISKLTDCAAEIAETQVWLDFALDCEYLNETTYEELIHLSEEVAKLLSYMMSNPGKFGASVT